MKNLLVSILAIFLCLMSVCSYAEDNLSDSKEEQSFSSESEDEGSFIGGVLMYLPNRVLDLFDIFRLRVRVGPGIAAGVRVTEPLSLYAGSYATVYAGLPGPRLEPTIKLPVGFESHNGASLSVADATIDGGVGPDYSSTEIGFSFHLFLIGFDFGVDPVEAADFATGVLAVDLRDDDL